MSRVQGQEAVPVGRGRWACPTVSEQQKGLNRRAHRALRNTHGIYVNVTLSEEGKRIQKHAVDETSQFRRWHNSRH